MSIERLSRLTQTLSSTAGDLKLSQFKGQPLVLYFYPRDNTPGCTQQGEDFRDLYADFEALGCAVVGASRDTLASHEKFAAKFEFPFPLIADPDEALCERFEVMKDKNMYGKKVRGIERSTFLYDSSGVLVESWRKVKVPGHVALVLEAVRGLS